MLLMFARQERLSDKESFDPRLLILSVVVEYGREKEASELNTRAKGSCQRDWKPLPIWIYETKVQAKAHTFFKRRWV